jgi:K+-transporting ATPase c subunit
VAATRALDPGLGFLGEERVNVTELDLALERLSR